MTSLLTNFATFTAHQKPTVGDLKMSAVGADHLGWLVCDGRSLNVSEWRALHNAIGYQFGGSGNTFNLPNPAGRVLGTIGSGSGLTTRALGTSVGTETHVLTVGEMPDHTHTIVDPGHAHTYVNQPNQHEVAVSLTTTDTADNINVNQTTGSNTTGITINYTGGAGSSDSNQTGGAGVAATAHENMQPTLFIGNTFIYSGKPTYGTWPLVNTSAATPPLSVYGGMPAIL